MNKDTDITRYTYMFNKMFYICIRCINMCMCREREKITKIDNIKILD